MPPNHRPSRAERWRKSAEKWQHATLTDRFLFNRVMKDTEVLLPALHRFVPELEIAAIDQVNAEFDLEHGQDIRGYRLDIFAVDNHQRKYDIEMQVVNYHNLLQRAIAYAASMIEEQLEHGGKYQELRPVHVIFLTKFDPLGYRTQFDQYELRSLKRLTEQLHPHLLSFTFINVAADQADTPPALRRLCRFIDRGEVDPTDPFIVKLSKKQALAKKNKEWRKIAMRINFNQQDQEWAMEQALAKAAQERERADLERNKAVRERQKANLERKKAAWEREQREKAETKQQTSITNLVKLLASSGNDEQSVVGKLMTVFDLSSSQAENYYRQTINPA